MASNDPMVEITKMLHCFIMSVCLCSFLYYFVKVLCVLLIGGISTVMATVVVGIEVSTEAGSQIVNLLHNSTIGLGQKFVSGLWQMSTQFLQASKPSGFIEGVERSLNSTLEYSFSERVVEKSGELYHAFRTIFRMYIRTHIEYNDILNIYMSLVVFLSYVFYGILWAFDRFVSKKKYLNAPRPIVYNGSVAHRDCHDRGVPTETGGSR